jgi:hypothetical protein
MVLVYAVKESDWKNVKEPPKQYKQPSIDFNPVERDQVPEAATVQDVDRRIGLATTGRTPGFARVANSSDAASLLRHIGNAAQENFYVVSVKY